MSVRRLLPLTLSLLITVLLAACDDSESAKRPAAPVTPELKQKAQAVHKKVMTLDSHIDIPFNFATSEDDPGVRGDTQVDLVKMREGGLNAGFFIVYVGQGERTPAGYAKAKAGALTKFAAIHRMTAEMYPDLIGLAESADQAETIHAAGRLVALIGIENGYVIGKDLSLLEVYHALGARYMTLTHGGHNDIGDSSQPRTDLGDAESEHGGLSDFGKEVVAEMNRLGILVDVSHTARQSMMDATIASKAPVIASHSNARALVDHPRNLDDEQLEAIRVTGGVVQTTAFPTYTAADPPEKTAALEALQAEYGLQDSGAWRSMSEERRTAFLDRRAEINAQFPLPTVSQYVDHIDYMVDMMGIDHVGISSDFQGGGGVEGWNDASETFNVTLELVRRGYTEEEIAKLWGGNILRVLREAKRIAAELQGKATPEREDADTSASETEEPGGALETP